MAVRVQGRSAHVEWSADGGGAGSLMVAGGRLFLEDSSGELYAYDPSTGRALQTLYLSSPVTHFPWLVALDNVLYAANGTSVEAFNGL